MCELFAMSSRFPATVTFSLAAFAQHGGGTGHHKDGWGIAYYAGQDAQVMREPKPAAKSACVRFIQEHQQQSDLVISHVRKATQGEVSLANTHPFTRELGGRTHVFAHNGKLDGIEALEGFALGRFRPVGTTDSEHAFCVLMARMEAAWERAGGLPSRQERQAVVQRFAAEIARLGPANFLYADSDVLFAHGNKRTQADGAMRPPGLRWLRRRCSGPRSALEEGGLHIRSPEGASSEQEQQVLLLASVPLTDEPWTAVGEGELLVIQRGELLARVPAAAPT